MKENINKNKKILIAGIILIFIVLCFVLGGNNNENINNNNTDIENGETEKTTQTEELVEYYKDDAIINLFINKYNQLYDEKITSEMLSVYHHQGNDHKNQVKLFIDNFEIILTGNTTKISVYIENTANSDSDEALRNLTKKLVKVYNQEVTDSQIEEHLNNQKSSSDIQTYDGIEYWTNKGLNDNIIKNIKITGSLK